MINFYPHPLPSSVYDLTSMEIEDLYEFKFLFLEVFVFIKINATPLFNKFT